MDDQWPFHCCVCGRFVGSKGQIVVREVWNADYWNGPDQVTDAWCAKHAAKEKRADA